jgi:flagellar hook assembly protein FlgD
MSLYDAGGRHVRTLASGEFAPGFHTTTWDGRDRQGRRVPGGIYFLNLNVEGQTRQMKVVVLP